MMMTGIWMEGSAGWGLQSPSPYENEKALHDMVTATPDLLPLSGRPRVTVIGREVLLPSGGRVDALGVEPDGRPVLIEVKLRNNNESRRAVVAQALSYAAAIHGMTYAEFEASVRSWCPEGLHEVVREGLQDEALDRVDFERSAGDHLVDGSFRVVVVLDEAPAELIRLMGYLEAVTTGLTTDLITISTYEIGDNRIAVPQRLEADRLPEQESTARRAPTKSSGVLVEGSAPFREAIEEEGGDHKNELLHLAMWAETVGELPGVLLQTYFGKGSITLLPRFAPELTGLVSVYRWTDGRPAIQLWRSVFERRAPGSIPRVEALIDKPLGQPTWLQGASDELLAALGDAYAEGAGKPLS